MIEPSRALLEQLHAGFKLISVGEPVLAKAWELLGEAALSEHFSDTIIFTSATFVLVPIGSDAQTGFVQEWINQAKEADLADFARFATTSKRAISLLLLLKTQLPCLMCCPALLHQHFAL